MQCVGYMHDAIIIENKLKVWQVKWNEEIWSPADGQTIRIERELEFIEPVRGSLSDRINQCQVTWIVSVFNAAFIKVIYSGIIAEGFRQGTGLDIHTSIPRKTDSQSVNIKLINEELNIL